MASSPTCRTCGTAVDLTRRNAVTSVIYRHVMCRGCGVICILEGPEQSVDLNPTQAGVPSAS
jgi:Pyruvate/2-oxoacid:ferredoxin oxidoreductase delta subunit